MSYEVRVKEMVDVPISEIVDNPENWRQHSAEQRAELEKSIESLGFVDPLLGYRDALGRVVLINGHLRVGSVPEGQSVPVVILDVDEEEARLLLATFDPIGQLATYAPDDLRILTYDVETISRAEAQEIQQQVADSLDVDEVRIELPPPEEDAETPEPTGPKDADMDGIFTYRMTFNSRETYDRWRVVVNALRERSDGEQQFSETIMRFVAGLGIEGI